MGKDVDGQETSTRRSQSLLDFRLILSTLADPVVAADATNRIVYANDATEALLGWAPNELIGRSVTVILPERFREIHIAAFERYVATRQAHIIGQPIRVPALHRDGTELDIELMLTAVPAGDELLIVASLRDLRERVELERQLKTTRYLQATSSAATRLTTLLDFDHVLDVVVDTLVTSFDAALARVWLAMPDTRALFLRAQGGPAQPPSETARDQLHYEALPVWIDHVARTETAFLKNGLSDDARFDTEWLEAQKIESVAALPLAIGGELIGVMVMFSCAPISGDMMEVLANFAALVTASLNDVQHVVREQEARADAEDARRRSAFLAEASNVLAESLEYETTLKNVAHLCVPHLADWCVVDVLDADGTLRRLEVAHVDPEKLRMAREFQERYPVDVNSSDAVTQVLHTGEPILVRDIPETALQAAARDEEHLHLLRSLGFRSYMCVPLAAHGRIRGVLSFVSAESGRRYGPSDLALAQDLANRAALAVDNARLYGELQDAIAMRDEFVSSVSHDLKNPLAAIRGRAQMMERRLPTLPADESERFAGNLQAIDTAVTRMTRLINDLVDVARLRTGQPLDLNRVPTDLVELVHQAVGETQHGAHRHTITVETVCSDLKGSWDAMRLERVLGNLLTNAIKFSPEGGEIVVEISREPDGGEEWAVVAVSDPGIGIPAADLPRIFERFHRGANVTGKIEGSGIGLAGTKQIVEQHGGTIAAQSREGEGATFTVRLPLQREGASVTAAS